MTVRGSGGGGGCFPAGVKVYTPSGEVPIELIKVGDKVLSFNYEGIIEESVVEKVFKHPSLPSGHLKYWGGELPVTSNHWVLNQFNSFAEAGTLTELDAIVDQLGHLRPVIEFVEDELQTVYNLHVIPNHTFIADGIRVHNGGLGLKTPVVGSGGGGGDKGGGGRAPVESPDSLRSQQFANVVDLISEGEVEGFENGAKDIFLDGTPLQNSDNSYNFSGFNYQTRNGTQDQLSIPGFAAVESEKYVGVEVLYGSPVVRQITTPDADFARVTVSVPALSSTDVNTGDVSGTSVQVQIELQANGGGFVNIPINGVISGKASSRYQREFYIPLAGSPPFDIRVTRLTPDSTTQYLQNKTFFDSYTEIIDQKLRYPNSALVAISVDSSQFNSVPTRGYLLKGMRIKVPDNYDPVTRTYTGVWLGDFKIAWSDNPAWVFYDLVTNSRYGLGEFVDEAMMDVGTLYQIAQYCDELVPDGYGGQEPRYTCNLYLQSREEAFNVLANIASIFSGMVYWSSGLITASIDKPTDKVTNFTNANVIDGLFEYSGSAQSSRHSVALVSWNDPADRYEPKVEYVEDTEAIAKLGVRETEVLSVGCTSRGQAHRMGKRILLTEKFLTETVSFKTGLEASRIYPGAVIGIQDNNRSGGRFGGRIKTATTLQVTLDSPITIESGLTYSISVILADGTVEERSVTNTIGSHTDIDISVPFTTAPANQSIWVISSSSLDTQLFKVISIKESDNLLWEVSALQYNPSKFDAIDLDTNFEPLRTSNLAATTFIASPTNLTISEELYKSSINQINGKMIVSWSAVSSSYLSGYIVAWRYTNSNWTILPLITNTLMEIAPILPGIVEVRVHAVNILGVTSIPVYQTKMLLGKTAPPANVSDFRIQIIGSSTYLNWNAIPDLDADYYEIRHSPMMIGATWQSSSVLLSNIAHPTVSVAVASLSGTYLIKAFDTSGNESINATSIISGLSDLNALNFIALLKEDPDFLGIKNSVEVVGSNLELSGSVMDDWGFLDSVESIRVGSSISSYGEYYFDNTIDLGDIYTSRIISKLNVFGSNLLNTMLTWNPLSIANPLSGTSGSTWSCVIQIRTTNDDPLTTPIWSSWSTFNVGEYTCRAFEFRAILQSFQEFVTPSISLLEVVVDMPDRVSGDNDIICTTSGYNVIYDPAFKDAPAVAIAAQGLTTGDYYVITSKSRTGFSIAFFNSANIPIERTFDWVAKGYGYVN